MTDCTVVWGTWARYHLVPILNTKPVAELNAPPNYCPRCEMATYTGITCARCYGPLVKR